LAKQVASVMGPGSNMMTAKRFAEMYGGIGRVEAAAIQGVARLAGAYGFDRTAVSHLARMTAGYAGIDKARIAGLTGMRGFDTSALRAMGILGVRTDLLRGLYGRLVFSEAELRSVMDATRSFRAYDSAAPQPASHELAVDLEVAVIEFGLLRWFLQLPWTAHAAVAMEVIGTAFAIADSVMLSVCDEGLPPQVTSYNGSAGHVIALILLMHGLAMKWRADNDAY
jgi:hypothetical protein